MGEKIGRQGPITGVNAHRFDHPDPGHRDEIGIGAPASVRNLVRMGAWGGFLQKAYMGCAYGFFLGPRFENSTNTLTLIRRRCIYNRVMSLKTI